MGINRPNKGVTSEGINYAGQGYVTKAEMDAIKPKVSDVGLFPQVNSDGGFDFVSLTDVTAEAPIDVIEADIASMSAQTWIDEAGVGWNLAGVMESESSSEWTGGFSEAEVTYFETVWSTPITTQAMIQMVADAGFGAVRVPVTWDQHIDWDSENRDISPYWMARLKEIVGWVLGAGMKCIINTHHDHSDYRGPGWLTVEPDGFDETLINFEKVWTNIANEFKDYSYNLIFEGYNEIAGDARNFGAPTTAEYANLNVLAQKFVDTIRATGGNNPSRILSINTYLALTMGIEQFEMPTDYVSDRLLAQVHNYSTYTDQILETEFSVYETYFTDNGIPLIIGEFGTESVIDLDSREDHALNFIARCKAHGFAAFWWDNRDYYSDIDYWVLLDRENMVWKYPTILNHLMLGLTEDPIDNSFIKDVTYTVATDILADKRLNGDGTVSTLSGAHFATPVACESGNKIIMTSTLDDGAFRFLRIAWYAGGVLQSCETFSASSAYVEKVVPDGMDAYDVGMYNPWADRAWAQIVSMFAGGQTITLQEQELVKIATTSVDVNEDTLTFTDLLPKTLVGTVLPATTDDSIVWSSSDVGVATVDNGNVIPIKAGSCTITLTSGEFSDTCSVLVDTVSTTAVLIEQDEVTFTTQDQQTLIAQVLPTDTDEITIWASSDEDVAIVVDGVVTPINNGTCVITAYSGEFSDSCNVTVTGLDVFRLPQGYIDAIGTRSYYIVEYSPSADSYWCVTSDVYLDRRYWYSNGSSMVHGKADSSSFNGKMYKSIDGGLTWADYGVSGTAVTNQNTWSTIDDQEIYQRN